MYREDDINYSINQWDYQNDKKIFYEKGYYYDIVDKVVFSDIDENAVMFEAILTSGNKAYIELYLNDNHNLNIRFKNHQAYNFIDLPYVENLINNKIDINVIQHNDDTIIESEQLNIVVKSAPFQVVIMNKEGYELFSTSVKKVSRMFITPALGFRIDSNNNADSFFSWNIANDEAIFGLGEKFGNVNKVGTRSVVTINDACATNSTDLSYKAVPVVLSNRGYSVVSLSSSKHTFDIADFCNESSSILCESPGLHILLSFEDSIKSLVTNQTKYFGLPGKILPAALGVWYSRCAYQSFNEMDHEMDTLKLNGIAFDFIHIDQWFTTNWYSMYWVDCCDFIWNEQKFPNPQEKLAEYTAAGTYVSTWVNPYLPAGTPIYEKAREQGVLLKTITGQSARIRRKNFDSPVGIIDLSTEKGKKFYQVYLKSYLKLGIRSIKPDYADRVPEDSLFNNGLSGKLMHNQYIHDYISTCANAVNDVYGDGLVWRRPGYLGCSKYPISWSGDVEPTFAGLRNTLRGGLSAGFTGDTLWSSDIGGFKGKPTKEVYIRWSQVGMLCSAARFHGTTEREAHYYGQEAIEVVRKYTNIRYRLLPYILRTYAESCINGMPVMRHMFMENENDKLCQNIDDQFYLGESIIVCPVTNSEKQRQVYLPAGTWVSLHDDKEYEGNRTYIVKTSIKDIPLFVRKGDAIEVNTKVVLNSSEFNDNDITYVCSDPNTPETIMNFNYQEIKKHRETIGNYSFITSFEK